MWGTIARGTAHRLSSGGWVANFVLGLAFLFMSPVLGNLMQRPQAAIISAAIGATIIVWVVAWAAYRSVPQSGASGGGVAQPVPRSEAPHEPSAASSQPSSRASDASLDRPNTQTAKVEKSPGASLYQAGRDVIVNARPAPAESRIRSLTLEVRLTCVLKKDHGELPPDEVPFWPVGDANAYLEGPAGRQRLQFASPVRFRKLADNRIVVVNRFALDSSGDLINQPIKVLSNYDKVIAPVITIVWGKEFEKFTLLEMSVSLNGSDPAYYSWPYDVAFQQGPTFTVAFDSLRKHLLASGSD